MRAILKGFGFFYSIALVALVFLIYVYYQLDCTETTQCYHAWANVSFLNKWENVETN